MLFGVLIFALGLSFTGCKDYDDDISDLKKEITDLQSKIDSETSQLTTKITSVESAITLLQTKDADLKAEIAALETKVAANLTAESERLAAAAQLAAATAKTEAIAAAKVELDALKASLENEIGLIKTDLTGHASRILALEQQMAALTARIDAIDADILTMKGNIVTMGNAITKLNSDLAQTIADVASYRAAVTMQASALETFETTLNEYIVKTTGNTTAINETKASLEVAFGAIEGLEGKYDALSAQLDYLLGVQNLLADQLDELGVEWSGNLSDLKTEMGSQMAALEAKLGVKIDDLAIEWGTKLDALRDELNGKLAELGIKLDNLDSALNTLDAATDKKLSDLEEILRGELSALQSTVETLTNTDLADLQEKIKVINEGLDVMQNALKDLMNEMITAIRIVSADYKGEMRVEGTYSLDDVNGSNMYFNISKSLTDFDFGYKQGYNEGFVKITTPYSGGFAFVKHQEQSDKKAISKVIVQVIPANAALTPEMISLIDTKGTTTVNSLMKATKVTKFNEQMTASVTRGLPTQTGLYEVTFELTDTEDAKHKGVTYVGTSYSSSDAKKVLFAVAVENKVSESTSATDRHVISTFGVTATMKDLPSVYALDYNVDDVSVTKLANRFFYWSSATDNYGLIDYRWSNDTPAKNTTPGSNVSVDQQGDVRGNKPFVYAGVGKTFTISFADANKPYAYYAVLDRGGLGLAEDEIVSERNAWNQYEFTGLEKVVLGDQKLDISITSAIAEHDIIGFRVIAINADGTLVDPDGKAFYVYCGEVNTRPALNFEMTFNGFESWVINRPTWKFDSNVSKIVRSEVNLTINGYIVQNSDFIFYSGTTGTVTVDPFADPAAWANVRSASLKPTTITALRLKDGVTYEGTIDLYINAGLTQQIKVATIPVSVKKTLPTAFIGDLSFKAGQAENNKLITYPVPNSGATAGTYTFKNGFNYVVSGAVKTELDANFHFHQNGTTPALLAFNQNISQNVTVNQGNVGAKANGSFDTFSVTASYNYGRISTVPSDNLYEVGWSNGAFAMEFHSYMEDCAYNWSASQSVTFNVDDQYINLNLIDVTSPYGETFNNLGWTKLPLIAATINTTPDVASPKRYSDITGAYMELTPGIRDEYFTVKVIKPTTFNGPTRLQFVKAADNSQSAPSTDLPATLYLKIMDDFNREITVPVNGTFIMKRGS